jgi:hypothetical protein
MNEAATLREALRGLLQECQREMDQWRAEHPFPAHASVEAQLRHLRTAETALLRLIDAADSQTCTEAAQEVLIAVAQFRNSLLAQVEEPSSVR